jgi:hypothetical protein
MREILVREAKLVLRLEASEKVDFDISEFFMSELTYLSKSKAFSEVRDFCRKRCPPLIMHVTVLVR